MITRQLIDDFGMNSIKDDYNDDLDSIKVILNKTFTSSYLVASLQEVYLGMSLLELFLNNDKKKSWEYMVKSNNCNYMLYKLANNIAPCLYFWNTILCLLVKGKKDMCFIKPQKYCPIQCFYLWLHLTV